MEKGIEKDVGVLSGLFTYIITDLKGSTPIWEDFVQKAGKMHSQLKVTMSCLNSFVEAMQRIADMATSAQGATRDVGKALTRLCLRHRTFENRFKTLIDAMQDALIIPMTDKIEDWKRITTQIDRAHSKEFKRARSELKKKNSDTLRLRKKVKRASIAGASGGGGGGIGGLNAAGVELAHKCLNHALQDVHDDYVLLEESQRQAVRRALIEQRRRYCAFVNCIKPVMDEEIHLLEEVSHLEEVVDSLCKLTTNPERLPTSSEQVIEDAKMGYTLMSESIYGYHGLQSPPSSPGSSLGSRKSSMCSISSESTSTDLYGQAHRSRSLSQPPPLQVSRLCSVSSQDSGFNSTHDTNARAFCNNPANHPASRRQTDGKCSQSVCSTIANNPIYDMRSSNTINPQAKVCCQSATSRQFVADDDSLENLRGPPVLPRRNGRNQASQSSYTGQQCSEKMPLSTTEGSGANVDSSSAPGSRRESAAIADDIADTLEHFHSPTLEQQSQHQPRYNHGSSRSEPQSPRLQSRQPPSEGSSLAESTSSSAQQSSDLEDAKGALLLLSRPPASQGPMHMNTLPARGRDRCRKVPPAPPVRRTPPTSTLNVALQLRQLEEQQLLSKSLMINTSENRSSGDGARSPELPLPSPPAELLSPSEENSIFAGRMIKSCHATLERPTRRASTSQIVPTTSANASLYHHHQPGADQAGGSSYRSDGHNAYLGGICSQIAEKFGGERTKLNGGHDTSNTSKGTVAGGNVCTGGSISHQNAYGTFGKTKKHTFIHTDSQESDEQTKSEGAVENGSFNKRHDTVLLRDRGSLAGNSEDQAVAANQRNSKMYKCASSDDILSGRPAGAWEETPASASTYEENVYEPLSKETNDSLHGGTSFGVSIAISANDLHAPFSTDSSTRRPGCGSVTGAKAADIDTVSARGALSDRLVTSQRRAHSVSNDLYGRIGDDEMTSPHSTKSKVQQVKATFEQVLIQQQQQQQHSSQQQRIASATGEPCGKLSQSATTSRCTSPSRPAPGSTISNYPGSRLSMYQPPPVGAQQQESAHTIGGLPQHNHHHSQFSIYATKNEVLTPGVPVSIPKVPTDLSKKRFMQQLNEKLAQGTGGSASLQPQQQQSASNSIYGTIRNCTTATIGKGGIGQGVRVVFLADNLSSPLFLVTHMC